jgi:predicted O-linked N-acetylglucosamine transferase (SPINDLY family)
MGVPVLALTSDRPVGRLCAHVLNTIGHPELVSPTGDAFLAAARKLSGNLVELEALRRHLRPSLIASPMMNAARLSRELEALLVKFATDFFAQQPRL